MEVQIGVEGRERHRGIFERARRQKLPIEGDVIKMLGISWRFVLVDRDGKQVKSKL